MRAQTKEFSLAIRYIECDPRATSPPSTPTNALGMNHPPTFRRLQSTQIRIGTLLGLSLLLTSCRGMLPIEPGGDGTTLVVGQVVLDAVNYVANGDASINGRHSVGIEIALEEVDTGRAFTVRSSSEEGFFFFRGIQGHRYRIVSLFFEEYGSSFNRAFIRNEFRDRGFRLPVSTGGIDLEGFEGQQVYTLGRLIWRSDAFGSANLRQVHGSSRLQREFGRRYPKSAWNRTVWTEIPLASIP